MFTPKVFAESDTATQLALIDSHPLGLLIAHDARGEPELAHLPFLLDRGTHGAPHRLRVHVARANPIWQCALASARPLTVVFSGPDAYVSPRWYEHPHEEVPTWNYAVVHARGRATGPMTRDELHDTLARLSARHEPDAADAWSLDALDPALREELYAAIVGFTITIETIEAKFKLGQNRGHGDRTGVIRGLEARGAPRDHELVALMKRSERGRRE